MSSTVKTTRASLHAMSAPNALRKTRPASVAGRLPSLDEHLVEPETTRDEIVNGRKVVAMPAEAPHADRHCDLDFLIRGHARPEYQSSSDMLTRLSAQDDFAADTSLRRKGIDPATGERYLEELAFEVVHAQTVGDVKERAAKLEKRGVRRVFAIFAEEGEVYEWSAKEHDFVRLQSDAVIDDPAFIKPLPVRAMLNAGDADNEVARALEAKGTPFIEELKRRSMAEGRAAGMLLSMMEARFGQVPAEVEVKVRGANLEELRAIWLRWMDASRLEDVLPAKMGAEGGR